jgi:hypothetical protein
MIDTLIRALEELRRRAGRARRMTVVEWVRQTLRAARRHEPLFV